VELCVGGREILPEGPSSVFFSQKFLILCEDSDKYRRRFERGMVKINLSIFFLVNKF
jgi:hypothetical protein